MTAPTPSSSTRIYVTGATGGIGRATAARLLRDGARVFLTDRDDAVHDVAAELGAQGAAVADVTDEAAVRASVEAAAAALGGLDGLFLNAGWEGRVAPLTTLEPADFRRVLDVNVFGVLYGLQAGLPHLQAAGGGSVVVTASVASFIGSPGLGPYCASKHAVLGLVRTAAAELGPVGIRVNSVHPGPIDNRMMESIEHLAAPGAEAAVRAGFTARIPVGRYGRNEEVAGLAAFLFSADASYCNGHGFVVDGGFRAG